MIGGAIKSDLYEVQKKGREAMKEINKTGVKSA